MRGNVITPAPTQLTTGQQSRLREQVVSAMNASLPGYPSVASVQILTSVELHDRLTLVLATDGLPDNWADRIRRRLNCAMPTVSEDGKFHSFIVNTQHVEIIPVPAASYGFAYAFESFRGMGYLIAKTAEHMGFRMDHTGLYLDVKNNGELVQSVCVSRDWTSALVLMGFDPYRCSYRIGDEKSMFAAVASGAYFSRDSFTNISADFTLGTEFIEYLNTENVQSRFTFPGSAPWIRKLQQDFPEVVAEYRAAKEGLMSKQIIDAKYSVAVIQEVTSVAAEDLELFKTDFENSMKHNFDLFIKSSQPSTIREAIGNYYVNWAAEIEARKAREAAAKKRRSLKKTV